MSFGRNLGVYFKSKPPINLPDPRRKLIGPGRRPGAADTVNRGELKAAESEIRAAGMRGKNDNEISLAQKLQIARALLQLQRAQRLRVWVDGGTVYLGPPDVTTGGVLRIRVDWLRAAQIADAPDKYLPALLRQVAMTEGQSPG